MPGLFMRILGTEGLMLAQQEHKMTGPSLQGLQRFNDTFCVCPLAFSYDFPGTRLL